MRNLNWVYILLFLLALILLLYFFGTAIPRLPLTGINPRAKAPQSTRNILNFLICDLSSSPGAEAIILRVPRDGEIQALYLTGDIQITGLPFSNFLAGGPASAALALSQAGLPVHHYVAIDLSAFEEVAASLVSDDIPGLAAELTPARLLAGLLSETATTGLAGEVLSKLRRIASGIETDLKPAALMALAARLNYSSPAGLKLYVPTSSSFTNILDDFLEGR